MFVRGVGERERERERKLVPQIIFLKFDDPSEI